MSRSEDILAVVDRIARVHFGGPRQLKLFSPSNNAVVRVNDGAHSYVVKLYAANRSNVDKELWLMNLVRAAGIPVATVEAADPSTLR